MSLSTAGVLVMMALVTVHGQNVDQRQTGNTNIHIVLDNVRIVAVVGGLPGSEDYDYNYDYSDLTIKPSPGVNATSTTEKPPTASSTLNGTTSTTEKVVEITPPSPSKNATTARAPAATPTRAPLTSTRAPTKAPLTTSRATPATSTRAPSTSTRAPTTTTTSTRRPEQQVQADVPVQVVFSPPRRPPGLQAQAHVLQAQNSTSASTRASCIEGYFKDREGNCRPKVKRMPQQTLLRKLIQMSQRQQQAKN